MNKFLLLLLCSIVFSFSVFSESLGKKQEVRKVFNDPAFKKLKQLTVLECIEEVQKIIKAPILFEAGLAEEISRNGLKYSLPEGMGSLGEDESIKKEMLSLILKKSNVVLLKRDKVYIAIHKNRIRAYKGFPKYKDSTAFYDEVVTHVFKLKHIDIHHARSFTAKLTDVGVAPIFISDKNWIYAKSYRSTIKDFYEILQFIDVPHEKEIKNK